MKRIILKRCDVERQTFRAGGKGGQHQNVTDSAVRYIHLPTGLRAEARSERSQHQNDQVAWRLLQAKLDRMVEDQLSERQAERYASKADASFGQQVRTYRLCGNNQVVTDHRSDYSAPTNRVLGRGDLDGLLRSVLLNREGA